MIGPLRPLGRAMSYAKKTLLGIRDGRARILRRVRLVRLGVSELG